MQGEPEAATDPTGEGLVRSIRSSEREVTLVGTAHISPESVRLVRETIERLRPDGVCIELDEGRYELLMHPEAIEKLDLLEVIRQRRFLPLMVGVLLGAYQARLGLRLGVEPGAELREAAKTAEAAGIPVHLVDRNIRTTLLRAWRRAGFWQKVRTLFQGAGPGGEAEPTDEALRELLSRDVITRLVAELGETLPMLKEVLIDERDIWIAERVREVPGDRLVVVVGAGHLDGVERNLLRESPQNTAPLAELPPKGVPGRLLGVGIPAVIVGLLIWTWATRGAAAASAGLMLWIWVNSIPAALGAALALAHPLTILAALLAAPFTSLTPVLGAGYVTAFVQAWVRPPRVHELRSLRSDALHPRAWYRNRALRIALAFLLPTIGSAIGTFVGGSWLLGGAFS